MQTEVWEGSKIGTVEEDTLEANDEHRNKVKGECSLKCITREGGRERAKRRDAQKGQRGGRSREEDSGGGCSSKRVSPSLDNTLTV